jgi:hypothetical protein
MLYIDNFFLFVFLFCLRTQSNKGLADLIHRTGYRVSHKLLIEFTNWASKPSVFPITPNHIYHVDATSPPLLFPAIQHKKIMAFFDGGRITPDGGVLLLAATE